MKTWLSRCLASLHCFGIPIKGGEREREREGESVCSFLIKFSSNRENKAVFNHVEARNGILLELPCGCLCFRFFTPSSLLTR